MIVADIIAAAGDATGLCDPLLIFPKITEAIDLLKTKSVAWDAMTAEMTICACNGIVTLPRNVLTPLGVATNGVPGIARDKWYIYHVNGSGPQGCQYGNAWYWDDKGERPTIREFDGHICNLLAIPQMATDNNAVIRIFGTDAFDRPIYTLNPDGSTTEGFLLAVNHNMPVITPQPIKWIQRIVKQPTNGFVQLKAVDPITGETFLLGDYEPGETEPNYRRIRVQCKSQIRMRYRRSTYAVANLNDFIPLNSRNAMIMALRAMKYYNLNKYDDGQKAETLAVRWLNEEQDTRNAQSGIGPQINVRDGVHNETLYGFGVEQYGPGWGQGDGGWN